MTFLKAKAKVNLFFQIVGKNFSNYHLIESLVVFTNDVYDLIEIHPSNENKTIVTNGEFSSHLLNEANNHIDKVLPFADNAQKYNCHLTKNIPIGAGLGGGSSDAAIVAKHISTQNLSTELVKIGADLPVCYYAKPAYCTGIGEILTPVLNFPEIYLVMVNPNKSLLTKDVFAVNQKFDSSSITDKPIDFSNNLTKLIDFIADLKNDLTNAAISIMPEIKAILSLIGQQNNCILTRMSGSGPTCFGIFADRTSAKLARANIKNLFPNYWVEYSKI